MVNVAVVADAINDNHELFSIEPQNGPGGEPVVPKVPLSCVNQPLVFPQYPFKSQICGAEPQKSCAGELVPHVVGGQPIIASKPQPVTELSEVNLNERQVPVDVYALGPCGVKMSEVPVISAICGDAVVGPSYTYKWSKVFSKSQSIKPSGQGAA